MRALTLIWCFIIAVGMSGCAGDHKERQEIAPAPITIGLRVATGPQESSPAPAPLADLKKIKTEVQASNNATQNSTRVLASRYRKSRKRFRASAATWLMCKPI